MMSWAVTAESTYSITGIMEAEDGPCHAILFPANRNGHLSVSKHVRTKHSADLDERPQVRQGGCLHSLLSLFRQRLIL